MSKAGKTLYFVSVATLLLVVYSVGHYLGNDGKTVGGPSAVDWKSCTYSSVNVSTTRQRALDAFGGRQRARLENLSPSSNDVYYVLSNTSTTASTSTGERLQAGEYVDLNFEQGNLWKGQIWLLSPTSTAQAVAIAECF